MWPNDDLMPRERDAAEKKTPPTPPAPRSVPQPVAPAPVVECQRCHIRHSANESCPGCGRRILNG